MNNIPKIIAIITIAALFGFLSLSPSFISIIILCAILVMPFAFTNPYKAIYVYIFLLPFFPPYLGMHIDYFGSLHGVRLLNILFLVPLLVRHFLIKEDRQFVLQARRKIFDFLVFTFFIFSSFSFLADKGFQGWAGGLYHLMIDYYLIYFILTRFLVNKEHFIKMTDVVISSALVFFTIGIIDYVLSIGIFTEYVKRVFPQFILSQDSSIGMIRFGFRRMQMSFGQPLSLGIYLCIIHMLILCNYSNKLQFVKRIVYMLTFLLAFVCFILSQARGPLLIDCFLIVIYLFVLKKFNKMIILIGFTVFVVILLLSGPLSDFYMDIKSLIFKSIYHLDTGRFRVDLFKNTLHNLHRVSFFGENRSLFNALETRFQEDTVIFYIQILVDHGLITFFVLIALLAKIMLDGLGLCLRIRENYIYGYFLAFTAQILCYFSISWVGMSRVYFWVVLPIIVAIIVNSQSYEKRVAKNG